MTSPFDFSKSITQTKEDLYTNEELFNKDYVPFVINRILANSQQTALLAGAMNQYSCLSKEMQYKFYLRGIPKTNSYTKYIKKEVSDINEDHLQYMCTSMNLSMHRAIGVYNLLGADVVQKEIDKKGGRK